MSICKLETKLKSRHNLYNDVIREESISCLISAFEKIRGLSQEYFDSLAKEKKINVSFATFGLNFI